MLHIKLKRITKCSNMVSIILPADPPSPRPWGWGQKVKIQLQNMDMLHIKSMESQIVATCMVANILLQTILYYLTTILKVVGWLLHVTGPQIYGGPGSLSHDFKIWPITFHGSGPSGPILFSCEKSHFNKNIYLTASLRTPQNWKYM